MIKTVVKVKLTSLNISMMKNQEIMQGQADQATSTYAPVNSNFQTSPYLHTMSTQTLIWKVTRLVLEYLLQITIKT